MNNKRWGESGNIFFTLFGAVALIGVVGMATATLLRGPLGTVVSLNQQTKVDTQLQIARKLVALDAAMNQGSCDLDAYIEPISPYTGVDCTQSPTGGGCLPATVGAAKQDTWGTDIGYCGWDHGVDACGLADVLIGDQAGVGTVVAVISAGPNRVFDVTCQDDPAPGTPAADDIYIVVPVDSDDIIFEWTYDEASDGVGGGLWSVMSGTPDTITTDKDIEISQDATFASGAYFEDTAFFGTGSKLDFGGGGLLSLPDETEAAVCNVANVAMLRVNTASGNQVIEICDPLATVLQDPDGDDWVAVGASSAIPGGADTEVQFNDGGAFGGDAKFIWNKGTSTLAVTGNAGVTGTGTIGTLSVTNNATVGGTLGAVGAVDFDSTLNVDGNMTGGVDSTVDIADNLDVTGTLDVAGATALGNTLSVAGNVNVNAGKFTIAAATGNTLIAGTLNGQGAADFDTTLNVDGNTTLVGTLNGQGAVDFDSTLNVDNNTTLGGTLAVTGNVGIGTAIETMSLSLGGALRIRNYTGAADGVACAITGTLSYNSVADTFLLCSSVGTWVLVGTSGGGGGGTGGLWTDEGTYISRGSAYVIDDAVALPAGLTGSGTRMSWYPQKFAFRAGAVTGTEWDEAQIGDYSVAMGLDTTASGANSFAMGDGTVASGDYSTALGVNTTAGPGQASFAAGEGATASGLYSAALGGWTTASGASSFAAGNSTTASGPTSVAMGSGLIAAGNQSAAFGRELNITATGDSSAGFGLTTTAPAVDPQISAAQSFGIFMGNHSGVDLATANTMLLAGGKLMIDPNIPATELATSALLTVDVEGDIGAIKYCDEAGGNCFTAADVSGGAIGAPGNDREVIFNSGGVLGTHANFVFASTGDFIVGSTQLDDTGTGNEDFRMFFDVSKGAFRAGRVWSTHWDDANVGNYSTALGYNTTADGGYSFAMGNNTTSSGASSTALGAGTTASGPYSIAMGFLTTASGASSVALGAGTTASGDSSTAMGAYTSAGAYSMAIGLTSVDPAVDPKVTGAQSLGIFMGNQTGVDVTAANTMSLMGGVLVIGDVAASTGGQALELDVTGDIGAVNYCDADGNNCFTAASVAGSAAPGNDREIFFNSNGVFYTDTNFVFTSAGRFGLGTFAPGQTLDVVGTAAISSDATIGGTLGVTGATTLSDTLGVTGIASFADDVALKDGLATDPALTFTSDPNTGLFSGGADILAFTTAGAEAFRVTAAGELAIGDTVASLGAQQLELDVTGDIGAVNYCDEAGNNCFTAAAVSSGGGVAPGNDREMIFNSAGVLSADSNFTYSAVGDVVFGGTGATTLQSGTTGQRPGVASNGMFRYNSDNDRFEAYQGGSWLDILTDASLAAGADRQIQFNSGGALGAETNFVFTSAGLFGVGTMVPDSILHITNTGHSSPPTWTAYIEATDSSVSWSKDQTSGLIVSVKPEPSNWTEVEHQSTGILASALISDTLGANTLDNEVAFQAQYGTYMGALAGATVTNAYGVKTVPYQRGAATITNMYDLYMATGYDDGTGSITNHWALYQEDATVPSYFAGNVGIGDTTPDIGSGGALKLDVEGPIGGTKYCDADGNNCFAASEVGTANAHGTDGNIQFNSANGLWSAANFNYTSTGDFIVGSSQLDDTGTGSEDSRMFFDVSKGAFRAGIATITEWDSANVGDYSVALGEKTKATANYSTALGSWTTASGFYSTAMGQGTTASGNRSTAMGADTVASGDYSTAMGAYTSAGNYSMAIGLTSVDPAVDPKVTGAQSLGIFMGNQTGVDVAAANTMSLMGGVLAIGDVAASTGDQALELDVTGDIGAVNYCDEAGNNCFTAATVAGGGGLWEDVSGTGDGPIRSTSGGINYASADFVFGSPQLANDGDGAHASRMFFDKSKGAFRAGAANSTDWEDANVGVNSTAFGYLARASGKNSFAVGYETHATGDYSTALGQSIMASGVSSMGLGRGLTVSGYHSISIGENNNDNGQDLTYLFGRGLTAGGADSIAHVKMAFGRKVQVDGAHAMAIGLGLAAGVAPVVSGDESLGIFMGDQSGVDVTDANTMSLMGGVLAIGDVAASTGDQALELDVTGDIGAVNYCDEAGNNCFTASEVGSTGGGLWEDASDVVRLKSSGVNYASADFVFGSPQLADDGDGTHDSRMFFDKSNSAFRAGLVTGNEWDFISSGQYSAAFGLNTTASGGASTALGSATTASGDASTAMGWNTTADSTWSTAMGNGTTASGVGSTAMGGDTTASGDSSTAMGNSTSAIGASSTAMGSATTASGDASTAMGWNTTADSTWSTAMGNGTTASGDASTAMGFFTTASGAYSTAMGAYTSAGHYSMAIGLSSVDPAVDPKVTGVQSLGIFMGNQTGVDVTAANTMSLMGGVLAIGDVAASTGDQALELDVTGDIGAVNYCDEAGNNCFTAAAVSSGGGVAPGNDREMIFNSAGVLSADSNFTYSAVGDVVFGGTGATTLQSGTTGQRPGVASNGMFRYNSDNDRFEAYQGGAWQDILTGSSLAAAPDRGIQFRSGGFFAAEAHFTYTSAGDFIVGSTQLDDTGTGNEDNRMFYDVSKGALRAGQVTGTQWDDANVGNYSTAMGSGTAASGWGSTAMGVGTTASGEYSTAMGWNTTASSWASTAMGQNTTASGDFSTAMGRLTIASGIFSTAMGAYTSAGNYSMAIGLTSVDPAVDPKVTGAQSLGIFMGNQTGVDVAAANTMSLMGGVLAIGDVAASTGVQALELDVTGDIGAVNYCDEAGNNCFVATDVSGGSAINDLSDAFTDYVTEENLIMGRESAAALTAGAQYNLFIGELAGATSANSTATTDFNTALGYNTLQDLTSGNRNTASGVSALASNTTGANNTASGMNTMSQNTTGYENTAIGMNALWSSVANQGSTAMGFEAMRYADDTTTGSLTYNAAFGYQALLGSATAANNTGVNNTALGAQALSSNTSGTSNTASGMTALYSNTTGAGNTASGRNAGRYLADGVSPNETTNNSVYIGYGTRASADGVTNENVFGFNAIGNGSNSVTLGNDDITKTVLKGDVGIGTDAPAANLHVEDATALIRIKNTDTATNSGVQLFNDLDNVFSLVIGGSTNATIPNKFAIWSTQTLNFPFVIDAAANIGIGDPSPDTGTGGQLKLDVEGPIGGTQYCDENGNNCFVASEVGATGGGMWENVSDVVRLKSSGVNYASADFVFGSPQLASDGDGTHASRMFFDKSKGAFRAGVADGVQWDDGSVGNRSIALGFGAIASAQDSIAIGNASSATANGAVAIGYPATANGTGAVALGVYATASQNDSSALGRDVRANVINSHARGFEVDASGQYSFAFGMGNATGVYPQVSGVSSFGIFMGDQSGVDVTDANTVSFMGATGGFGIGTATPTVELDVAGGTTKSLVFRAELTAGAAAPVGASAVGGNNGEIQFNSAGSYGASSNLFWDDANGRLGIGTTTPGYTLEVNGDAAKPGGGTWTNTSDARLKDHLGAFDGGLDEILALAPVRFRYKEGNVRGHDSAPAYVGFMAQDVVKVLPGAVSQGADGYYNLDTHVINVALVGAIKELKAQKDMEIAALMSKNGLLLRRVSTLETERDAVNARLDLLVREVNGMKAHTGYGVAQASMGSVIVVTMVVAFGTLGIVLFLGGLIRRRQKGVRA